MTEPSTARADAREPSRGRWSATILAILGIAGIAFLAYSNSFGVPFVFDDRFWIVGNPAVQAIGAWDDVAKVYWQGPNRFVGIMTLALNFRLGGLDVTGYHAFNFGVHLATALLIFVLVRLTFRSPRMRSSAIARQGVVVGFAAALLFVAHPLQTQAVTYIVQRLASLATFFYVLALVLYAWWRTRGGAGTGRLTVTVVFGVAIVATILLAMKTKEIAFTLPFCILLYEWVFFDPPRRAQLPVLFGVLATLPVIPLSFLRPGTPIDHALSAASTVPSALQPLSRLEYARTQVVVVGRYLQLLAFPAAQNVDHDVRPVASLLEPRVVLSLAMLVALAAVAAVLWWAVMRRGAARADPGALLVVFGVCWFFLGLSVESTVIPIPDLIAEHRVYLPSVGLSIAAAYVLVAIALRLAPKRGALVAAVVATALGLVLAWATHQRNELWRDELELWLDAAQKSPGRARPHINIASTLARRGDLEGAVQRYRVALAIDPYEAETQNNMGIACFKTNRIDEAISHFELAIRLNPDFGNAYYNLGIALGKKGQTQEAMEAMSKGLRLGSTPRP